MFPVDVMSCAFLFDILVEYLVVAPPGGVEGWSAQLVEGLKLNYKKPGRCQKIAD